MSEPFEKATGRRIILTNDLKKKIKKLYIDLSKDIKKKNLKYKNINSKTAIMQNAYLRDLQKELTNRIYDINKSTNRLIQQGMINIAKSVISDNDKLLYEIGFKAKTSNIAGDIVADVISGKLYEGRWTLSKSIWSDSEKKIDDINSIIARGIAEQKPTYDIAKDLEKYVDPRLRKDWDWSKVYPGTSKVIDYNAQRLARTMVSHAYQESFVRATKENPFITGYRWVASGGDRMCPICEERDGNIYAKDDLPLDHPNGMCTFEIVMSDDYDSIGIKLADWVNDEGDEKLNEEIDNFINDLYYQGKSNYFINNLDKRNLVNNKILSKVD